MNQKHLLRFIKKRMKTNADDVVCQDDSGNEMTLREVNILSVCQSPYFPQFTYSLGSDVNKDLGLKALETSGSNFSPVFLHRVLLLKCCGCFCVRILFLVLTAFCPFMNKWKFIVVNDN